MKVTMIDSAINLATHTTKDIQNGFGLSRTADELVIFKEQKWVQYETVALVVKALRLKNVSLQHQLNKTKQTTEAP